MEVGDMYCEVGIMVHRDDNDRNTNKRNLGFVIEINTNLKKILNLCKGVHRLYRKENSTLIYTNISSKHLPTNRF